MSRLIQEHHQSLSSYWVINRIGDEARMPRFFNETLPFSKVVPYRLTKRDVHFNDDVPLHYAPSLEIVLYENLSGNVVVDNQHMYIQNNSVVLNPPMTVHGGWVTSDSDGSCIYCLQVSLEHMAHYIQLENFLAEKSLSLNNAPIIIPEYEQIHALMNDLFRCDDNVFLRNISILSIFEIIARHIPSSDVYVDIKHKSMETLKTLISWTHHNFAKRVTLNDAAAMVGYSKHYFCKWFKKQTNMSFVQYLKRVRVYNAGTLLLAGKSVSEAGYASGFENMSYFIKCFKEIRGCPPKQFVEAIRMYSN